MLLLLVPLTSRSARILLLVHNSVSKSHRQNRTFGDEASCSASECSIIKRLDLYSTVAGLDVAVHLGVCVLGVTAGGAGVDVAHITAKVKVDAGAGQLTGAVLDALALCHDVERGRGRGATAHVQHVTKRV